MLLSCGAAGGPGGTSVRACLDVRCHDCALLLPSMPFIHRRRFRFEAKPLYCSMRREGRVGMMQIVLHAPRVTFDLTPSYSLRVIPLTTSPRVERSESFEFLKLSARSGVIGSQ